MARIAYLGPEGTFTEAALSNMAAAGVVPAGFTPVPMDSTPAALEAVRSGAADLACVPIENSIEGGVLPTLDSLATGAPLQIYAELTLDVAFSIVTRPGTSAAEVKTVAAGHADAGVSTALAAQRYQLACLAEGVVDEPTARTRFVLVGPPGPPPPRTGADRTSVVLRMDNTPGALAAAMNEFGIRDIDLTRIESRPTRTGLGTYIFLLDCVGHIDDSAVAEALKALHRRCADVRYLGSWPTGSLTGAVPPEPDEADRWLARLRKGTPP